MNDSRKHPSFNERVLALLSRLEFRRARTEAERDAIFRLRYDAYLIEGAISPTSTGRFSDQWDAEENTILFGVFLDDELAATARITLSSARDPNTPSRSSFEDVLVPLWRSGYSLIEPSRWVIDSRYGRMHAEFPFVILRFFCMAVEYFDATALLSIVRREHAAFYRRLLGSRIISDPRLCPPLKKPLICMLSESDSFLDQIYNRYPFMVSTPEEREFIFGVIRDLRTGPFYKASPIASKSPSNIASVGDLVLEADALALSNVENENDPLIAGALRPFFTAEEFKSIVESKAIKPLEVAHIIDHAVHVFGSESVAFSWLRKNNRSLGGKSPLDVLSSADSAGRIEEMLNQIDFGIYP